jgi:hypothetical protein
MEHVQQRQVGMLVDQQMVLLVAKWFPKLA